MSSHTSKILHTTNTTQMHSEMQGHTAAENYILTGHLVERLPWLLESECRQMVVQENTTGIPATEGRTLLELFAQQVQSHPEAIAISGEQGQVSYGELDRRANQLAHYLQRLGIGPEIPVGMCLERSPQLLIAVLGILKAGGVYLPLDRVYPLARLQFMLTDAQAPVLLTSRSLSEQIPLQTCHVLCLEQLSKTLATLPDTPPVCTLVPEHIAYVIYTSGSTGRPKGTMITHRSWGNLILTQHQLFGAEAFHHTLQFSSVSFDASIWEIGGTLASGGTLHMLSQDPFLLGPDLLKILQEQAITITLLPPSLLLALPDATLPHLTTLVTGGEACPAEVVARWTVGRRFFNAYGPTEATVCVTVGNCLPGDQKPSIGYPLANTEVYVLDEAQQPVQIGQPGELYIGGIALARGYLGQPALTATRFIPHPFSDQPGSRLYRTGDLVRHQPDGSLEYVGRIDAQVKLRGFRIELGEIEQVLMQQPEVRQAVVLIREDGARGKQLVGYVVPQEGHTLRKNRLKEELLRQLPKYMVPSFLITLDALPLSANGKIDRSALPAPELRQATIETTSIAPRTANEHALATIWKEVMGVARVSIEDDFFACGGHSLLAMIMISRIRERLGVDIPLQTFFTCRTIARLAEALEVPDEENALPALQPEQRSDPVLASFDQQRLWFLDQLEPGLNAYNIPFAAFLRGNLRQDCLRSSLEELIKRHEILRTTFELREGDLVQRVGTTSPAMLTVLDVSELPLERREEQALLLAQEEVRHPFDLRHGPLLRALLIRLDEEEHLLVLTLHHIITDGWSQGILLRELAAGYEAALHGHPPVLPPLPIQYADYTTWQRKWVQGAKLHRQLAYWKQQLAGAPQVLELVTDRPRPPVQRHCGASMGQPLPPALTHEVRQVSQREGVTPFMLLLSAFAILISRMSGQQDFLIGTAIAGRTRRELEDLIGFFANTLPLRLRLHGHPNGRQVLQRVREMTLQAYAHQEVPFEQIVEALQPPRDLSRNPLLQIFFTLDNTSDTLPFLQDLSLTPVDHLAQTARFDLTLAVTQRGENLHLVLEYDTDLFEPDSMERLLARYPVILASLLANLAQPVERLPWLLEHEQRHLFAQGNPIDQSVTEDHTLLDLFAQQVLAQPEAIALSSQQEQLSYGELDRRANQLAHYLQALGVGPDIPVGLCLQRSPEFLIALLAILKAGGISLPLDPSYPAARLQFMLSDAQAPVLLTSHALLGQLPLQACHVLCLDQLAQTLAACPDSPPTCALQPEHLAYIIYTSGSTGQPKGVMIPHRAIAHLVWQTNYIQIDPTDRFAQTSNTSFDAVLFEIWGALLNGAQLVIVPREVILMPTELAAFLRVQDISILFLTTALFHQVAQQVPDAFGTVRDVFFGGEAADPDCIRLVLSHNPPARLVNGYGPTENTTFSTWYAVEQITQEAVTVPIGSPLAHSHAYILDATLQPVPPGVPGELYVGGDRLARGYLAQPALTAERFVPHPFSTQPGARLYRTGDQVQARSDGAIEFLHRIDSQVKIRGFRIELGEIEAVLRQHPDVQEAVVLARAEANGDRRLAAYILASRAHAASISDLRDFLKEYLPEYMRPAAFVLLDALPLTPNGKVDKRALPVPQAGQHEVDDEQYVPARNATEELLASVWAEVLGVEQVGVYDNFFDLGGHSLLATRIVSRLRETLQTELPLSRLFEKPTVALLAASIQDDIQAQTVSQTQLIPAAPRQEKIPLSFAQQRLWFIHQFDPQSCAYNTFLVMRLAGLLDTSALEWSLSEIVRRHEILRTTFIEEEGESVQNVLPQQALDFSLTQLTEYERHVRDGIATQIATRVIAHHFDLTTGPLFRAHLIELDEQEHMLVLNMHHIVSDGWSLGVLMQELSSLYVARRHGRPSPLAPLPIQYADFAIWQHSWLQGELLEQQLGYWKNQLAGPLPILALPTDYPRPPRLSTRGATLSFQLSAHLSEQLKLLSQHEGVTLFMTLLTAFQVLLARYSGQDDILVGTPIAGRTRGEVEELIGFFVNTLVIRTDLSGSPTFLQVLQRVREVTLAAYAHQELPFEKLVEVLQPERDLSRNPLFQVMFILQNAATMPTQMADVSVAYQHVSNGTAIFDLMLSFEEKAEGLEGNLDYSTDLFIEERMQRLSTHLRALLEAIVADPTRSLGELPLWSSTIALEEAEFDELFA